MQCTTVPANIQRLKNEILPYFPQVTAIVEALRASGGRALLVGGAVRDLLLGYKVKDLDIEIHGIELTQIEKILGRFGFVRLVGKQFGVLRIDGIDIDWSIPRTDGSGRKPRVEFDPHMPLERAFARRDLTINAMGIDLVAYTLIDPFEGCRDLQRKVLRAPDPELFVQDPLRFFRVMQFIGRFGFLPDTQLNELCTKMDLTDIAPERIYQEYEKLFLKSAQPSLGLKWLEDIGRLKKLLPELYNTRAIQQEPSWHPEGDVFEHSMQALDKAAQIECSNDQERLTLMMAALCHDLGKVTATRVVEGKIRAIGHDIEGVPLARALLARITNKHDIRDTVLVLVRYHMMPGQFIKNGAGDAAYKRLAKKLAPHTHCEMLTKLARADHSGRNPLKGAPLSDLPTGVLEQFYQKAQKLGVLHAPEAPVLMGADLINQVTPGPLMGRMLEHAYTIQIENGITDKEELKKRVLKEEKE